ncbi:hypothetical protein J8I26_21575 [Herbaspirillum sp. LeCh32-8]|uniref:hypothetical protein n=1 Tax=Herbaspirillum sp. LeCh32-8 TaxID=2821356 RepID=UPI001AE8873C|nr:hypothetical protein [Herbaspirillum sp. LeCh32-8]MBP0600718.1 hypothetical protein [Herbaspirillum sp. LeCh32-8]
MYSPAAPARPIDTMGAILAYFTRPSIVVKDLNNVQKTSVFAAIAMCAYAIIGQHHPEQRAHALIAASGHIKQR